MARPSLPPACMDRGSPSAFQRPWCCVPCGLPVLPAQAWYVLGSITHSSCFCLLFLGAWSASHRSASASASASASQTQLSGGPCVVGD
ncbi:hypothetical protein GQ607_005977 [Colletotrichum asianum]|uniref:Uncharacterized protein n=1 Tax=Colletotrichum asianum TaxID=702518 RepID=A0A8H3ZNV6_9PEZI|nr:hypothetical protein GQ607_005977 [Colletotrichum asianum]